MLDAHLGADTFIISEDDHLNGKTIEGTAEQGTTDTLRLDSPSTYDLSSAAISDIDQILLNDAFGVFDLTVTNFEVSTADANGDATLGDLQIGAAIPMTDGVTINASGLTGSNHIIVDGTNLGGTDTINGGAGDDVIATGGGADTISGGAGNDTLDGGDGDDFLAGGAGNDLLQGGADADQLDGGKGINTASYENALAGVTADLNDSANNTGDAFGDTYKNIQNLAGSNHSDQLVGDKAANVLNGGGDADTLVGNGGKDTLIGGFGNDFLTGGKNDDTFVFAPGFGDDTVTDLDKQDTLDLSGLSFNSLQEVWDNTVDDGSNAVITSGTDTITLEGVTLAQLQSHSFDVLV